MIEATHLRIDNLVKRNDMDGIYSIRALCKDRVHPIELTEWFRDSKGNKGGYADQCTLSELEPIALTVKILLASGFSLTPGVTYECYSGTGIAISKYGDAFTFDLTKIEYVHQLQNLYFAILGKELQINLV